MFAKKYSRYYDLFHREKPYKKEIDFVYKWAEKPKTIFDIGCGTAKYWKYYPDKTAIVGIDKSRAMASIAGGIICADITKYEAQGSFDCATALFDVLNYIPNLGWFDNIPVKKGGHFIFDVWDKEKVDRDGFEETHKKVNGIFRRITPGFYDGFDVELKIEVIESNKRFVENHQMYVHGLEDIERACGKDWQISGIQKTNTWQTWYKLKKR